MRRLGLCAALLVLASCVDEPRSELDSDTRQIVAAIFAYHAEASAENIEFIANTPDMQPAFYEFMDFRICVARELAGKAADFRHANREGDISLSMDYPAVWHGAKDRTPLPRDLILADLRWDGAFKYCPMGVLRISHPQANGDSATISIQNDCSAWCSWGGIYELKRTKEGWELGEMKEGWMS